MKIIKEKNTMKFCLTDTFDPKFLIPIFKNAIEKVENDWDDYNEAFHFCSLLSKLKEINGAHVDYHYIENNGECVGIVIFSYGELDPIMFNMPSGCTIGDRELVMNYFHISKEGRGNGEWWLKEVVLPYYRSIGFHKIYVKSSHQRVFSLYQRLGKQIGEYTTKSDNKKYTRNGKLFSISL